MNLIEKIAEVKIRISRGQGIFYDLRNAGIIAATLKIILELSVIQAIFLTVGVMFGFLLVWHLDLNYFKLMQKEAELSSSKYNPHLDQINQIAKSLNNKDTSTKHGK